MDSIQENIVEPSILFAKNSARLIRKCHKPDQKEFQKVAIATAIGTLGMGFIGFLIKLIHVPINNILVGN